MGEVVAWRGGELADGTIARLSPRLALIGGDEIGPSSALLSPADARAIIAEADAALEPCGKDFGREQASIMLAVFAGARAGQRDEAKVEQGARDLYVRAVSTALARAPKAVVKQVVEDVVMTHRYGYPLPADITSRIDKITAPIRRAADTARAHLREATRRAEKRRKAAELDARVEADREAVRAGFDELMRGVARGKAIPPETPRAPVSEAQRQAAALSAVDRVAYWRMVGEGVAPVEAVRLAPTLPAESVEQHTVEVST